MDIAAGQKATRPLTLTAAHVKTFAELTSDYNPLHAEVLPVHPTKPATQLKITVKRQDGETVLEGEAWCYTFR
ncbi:hypothetical protein L0337_29300 [candidate division KSB1 bacterium]|nr:hypothetical protein [candidate division KSB1 bacterium]